MKKKTTCHVTFGTTSPLSRDFWHYFSVLLIHKQMSPDPHTNASQLSNKCPVIRTPQQQVALLSRFKADRTIPPPLNFYFLLFYFIQGCNKIYHVTVVR